MLSALYVIARPSLSIRHTGVSVTEA